MGGAGFAGGVFDWATAAVLLLVATDVLDSFFSGSVGAFEIGETDGAGAGCCECCFDCSATLGVAVLTATFGSSRTVGFGSWLTVGFGSSRTTGRRSSVLAGEAGAGDGTD